MQYDFQIHLRHLLVPQIWQAYKETQKNPPL